MLKRNYLAMLVAEFLGTGVLTLVVLSVQRSQLGLAFFVALAAGMAIIALTFVFGRASVAHFNPAITLAFWTARRMKTVKALFFILFQILGAWAAYGLYHYFVNTNVQEITQAFNGRIMVAEAIGTMILALACAAAAYHEFDNARAAVVSGLGLSLGIIVASAASVAIVNPAVALGVRAWDVFGSQGWGNFVLGPVLGAVIGVNLYGLLFANPAAPFSFFRRRAAATSVSSRSPVVEDELEDEDDDEDESDIDVDKAVAANAAAGRSNVAPRSNVTVTKSKKSAVNKLAATKKSAPKKRK
jgi:glycerol uptake facilitator-like aquaporin